MSINGKRTNFTKEDLIYFVEQFTVKNTQAIINEAVSATHQFRILAEKFNLPSKVIDKIESEFRKL